QGHPRRTHDALLVSVAGVAGGFPCCITPASRLRGLPGLPPAQRRETIGTGRPRRKTMTLLLAGRTEALADGHQLAQPTALLEAEGAQALRVPMLRILDAPDPAPVLGWIDELIAGRFNRVVLMTGEAVRRLAGFADRAGRRDAFVEALARTWTLTR